MKSELEKKELTLKGTLERLRGCVIAFSGGLDSTYLAVTAKRHVRGRVACITLVDQATPSDDIGHARESASMHGLEHIVIETGIPAEVRANGPDRCYLCKRRLFGMLEIFRAEHGLEVILDGENASDAEDDRPGSRAAREARVRSPLAEVGLSKAEIRELARDAGIASWSRPPSACLSTRIQVGTPIDDTVLRKADRTEQFIRSKGIRMIRARAEGNGTRLELGRDENTERNRALLESLEAEILAFGWASMTMDPGGYMPAGLRKRNDGK